MEFDELQQIWDCQDSRPLYTIDEKVLHDRILLKKKQAHHITNTSELLLIIVYGGAGCFLLGINGFHRGSNFFMYLLAAWMFGNSLILLMSRIRRIKRNNRFERSMRGDLDNAISIATYQVRLSLLMRWNVFPIVILILLGYWEGGKSIWITIGTLIFFAFAYYAGGFEYRFYKARKRELQLFQKDLEKER
jgi:Flp pilus assembly protein TadB